MTTPHAFVQIMNQAPFLDGELSIPENATGLVIFAHGSGSSRLSPRNRAVAHHLNRQGLATLLFDLLTQEESKVRENVFDIDLLAQRLIGATRWTKTQLQLKNLNLGYFGASTGAAAALAAASILAHANENIISAVVSRGGRPDLVGSKLSFVQCPTLLLVGSNDPEVLELNRTVLPLLPHGELIIIPQATHLFEEPGALEQVADEAGQWFSRYLNPIKRWSAA